MKVEQEIKQFMNDLGVDLVGIAGPGRFDGPPSLDPTYVLESAKSIISYAIPLDAQAAYDYLSKKSAIPHNIDQIRKMQRSMHVGLKLSRFLEGKGYKAGTIGCNIRYRRDPDIFSTNPRFSHRYGAYVTGIAAPGISGNAVTEKYGAFVVLNTVFTDAILESDPILDPRHFFDGRCQECMACRASCPPKMYEADEEEYALINGELYPRGKKRSIDLCNVACFGLHALSSTKKWSSWGKTWQPDWVGKEPLPEGNNLRKTLLKAFLSVKDLANRVQPLFDTYSKPWKEGFFEDKKNFPDYEDLPGETEGRKLRAYAGILEKICGFHIDDPIGMTCATCFMVCGQNPEESINRYSMLSQGGIVAYAPGNELVILDNYEDAVAQRAKYQYKNRAIVKLEFWWLQIRNTFKYIGFDVHTLKYKNKYKQRLIEAMADELSKEKSMKNKNCNAPREEAMADELSKEKSMKNKKRNAPREAA